MKTRIVHTRFWNDSFVCELNQKEKLLFIYLLTNEKVNLIGIYELPDKYIKADLEITQPELDAAKRKFQIANKIIFLNGWVKIVNHDKYNSYQGAKTGIARDRELTEVPKELVEYQGSIDTSIDTSSDTPNNQKSETINNKYNKIEDCKEEDFEVIADKYQVPVSFVRSRYDDMVNWASAKGGNPYKNYYSALCNWVKKDALKIKQDYAKQSSDIAL